jgi:ribosome-interacting GTPase 1
MEKKTNELIYSYIWNNQVVKTKIWGPSSKYSGQTVGLKHKLKDLDVVEFRTR